MLRCITLLGSYLIIFSIWLSEGERNELWHFTGKETIRDKSPFLYRWITRTAASDIKKVMRMIILVLTFGLRHHNIHYWWTLLLCGIPCSLQSHGLYLLWKEWYVIYYLYLLFFTVCYNGQMVSSIFMEFGEGEKSLESCFKSGRSTACLHPFIIHGTAGLSIFPIILNTLKTWVFIRDFHVTIFVDNIFMQLFWGME